MKNNFQITVKEKGTHHVEFTVKDQDNFTFDISCKWDGCVNIWRFFNDATNTGDKSSEHTDYIHICSLREFIEILQTIEKARDVELPQYVNEFE